jgi:hypothetical protein
LRSPGKPKGRHSDRPIGKSMVENNDDDAIAVLIGLGVLAVVGVGVFKVLKAIAEYQPREIINETQAADLASIYSGTYESSPNCEIHGEDAQLCANCHGCIECIGRDDFEFCINCYYD